MYLFLFFFENNKKLNILQYNEVRWDTSNYGS